MTTALETPVTNAPPPVNYGCRPGQHYEGITFCRNPNGTVDPLSACLAGETLVAGICTPPPMTCHVGQAQIGNKCIEVPAHTIQVPINDCGFDITVVAAVLIVKILQCKG